MSDAELEVLVELEHTRALLRELLDALLEDGYSFHRDSALSEWWNEDARRPKNRA